MRPLDVVTPATARIAAPPATQPGRLQKTASQLEGMFVQQMFKAMRDTVPPDGTADGGNGEGMFTAMFDEQLAERAPAQWHHGLGDAIVKALAPHIAPPCPAPTSPVAGVGSGSSHRPTTECR